MYVLVCFFNSMCYIWKYILVYECWKHLFLFLFLCFLNHNTNYADYSHVVRPIQTNWPVCWSLLDRCVTLLALVGVCFHSTEHAYSYRNIRFLPSQWELVCVCWCSVNMTVIFHKILNSTTNLSQLVWWSLLAFVCAVWIGLQRNLHQQLNYVHN